MVVVADQAVRASAPSAAGSLQADFDGDGFIDLAVAVPFEDIGAAVDAGAVSMLYGSAGGRTGAGSQAFWQGSGAAGTAEAGDLLGLAFVGSDLATGASATASSRPQVGTTIRDAFPDR